MQKLIIHNNQQVQYHSSRAQSLEYNTRNHKYKIQNCQLIHRNSALKSCYSKCVLEMEHKFGNLQVTTEFIHMQVKDPFWISTKISTGTYNSTTATFSMTKILQCPKDFLIYYLKENTSHYAV